MANGILPVARTKIAQQVVTWRETIEAFLTRGVDSNAFMASIVMEANDLRFHLSDKELNDHRTVQSFIRAAVNSAVVGLIPGAALGHCYFIPYTLHKDKPQLKHTAIQWIPGYRGYLELGYRSNFLTYVATEVVLTGETLRRGHKTDGPWVEHDIPVPRERAERQNVIGAYCTYATRLGAASVVFVERHEIDEVDTQRNVWRSNYVEMAKKTAVRRAAKLWQVRQAMASAIMLDETAEREEQQPKLYEDKEREQDSVDLDSLQEQDA